MPWVEKAERCLWVYVPAPTSEASHKWVPRPPVHLINWLQNQADSHDSFRFSNSLERLAKLKKALYFWFSFIAKDIDQDETHRARPRRVLDTKLL